MGAPLAPVPNVVRTVLEGFVDTSDANTLWANVLHFTYTGVPPSQASALAFANHVTNTWTTNVASLCPSPTTLQVVTVTDLSSPTGAEAEELFLVPGQRGDDSIPANAAVLVSYPSTSRYKGGKPRTYLYALGNADLSGATHWSSAATLEVQNKWNAFLTGCTGFTSAGTTYTSFCSIRYRGKFLPNGGPPHFYLTTPIVNVIPSGTAVARQQMASQRGRIERRRS